MRVEERHLAAIALVACLFLPYYADLTHYTADWSLLLVLAVPLIGGPMPLLSGAACTMVAILMCTNPRGAFWPAIGWLALCFVGLSMATLAGWSDRRGIPWWPWTCALLAGARTLSVAIRAPLPGDQRTDPSVFD